MNEEITIISLDDLLRDHQKVSQEQVAETNRRIKGVMKTTVRSFQKKQRASLEKASKIVLNA